MKKSMARIFALFILLATITPVFAQIEIPTRKITYKEDKIAKGNKNGNTWFFGLKGGVNMAFGDDSYDIFKDLPENLGWCAGGSLGKWITPAFGLRFDARYQQLYSRVNLESYYANKDDYPEFYPRKGFYGYNCYTAEAHALLNLTNLIWPSRKNHIFNFSLLAGGGVNLVNGYDKNVENWKEEAGKLPGGFYEIDTRQHIMPSGTIGGIIEFKLSRNLSLNIEALGTFTGDLLEGIKYEENYDVYINAMIGLTTYF